MKYRKLGSSNLEVSVVALGCMTFTGDSNWGTAGGKRLVRNGSCRI